MTTTAGPSVAGFRLARALADRIGEGTGGHELAAAMDNLATGRRVFDWIHLGKCDISIRDLTEAIGVCAAQAPRTGHLGDWRDISACRSGLLDYNYTICAALGIGYPLLFDTTSVESNALDKGDTIYLPGSAVSDGTRTILPLYARDPSGLRPLDRSRSWFSPFVLTDADGCLETLSDYHRRHNSELPLRVDYVSHRLLRDPHRLRDLLHTALDAARLSDRPDVLTSALFAGLSGPDGAALNGSVQRAQSGYFIGDRLVGQEELVELTLLPFLTLNEEQHRQRHLAGDNRESVPLMSNLLLTLLLAQVPVHRESPLPPGEIDEHLHWGAVGMAGFPPRKRGYFEGSEYPRRIRPFAERANASHLVPPLLFLVSPAVIFALLPRMSSGHDAELVGDLCRTVRATAAGISNPHRSAERIQQVATDWYEEHGMQLSAFYREQCTGRRSLTEHGRPPEDPTVAVIPEFMDLTCRQASLIVGALQQVGTV